LVEALDLGALPGSHIRSNRTPSPGKFPS
jgi:hypothetical protein